MQKYAICCMIWSLIIAGLPSEGRSQEVTSTRHATLTDPVEFIIWAEPWTQGAIRKDPTAQGLYGAYLQKQFEQEHPGVHVILESQGWDESLRQNLYNSLLLDAAPDVTVGENYFHQFIEMGAFVPLDDDIADIRNDLIPATIRAAQYDGKTYGLPSFTGVFGFERNCEVITAAGLDCEKPPQTWDELLEHAKIITERGNGEYYGYSLQGPAGLVIAVGSIFRIAVFLAQADATICQDNCTRPYFNDPKAIPVMEFIRELNRYTPPGLTFNPDEAQLYSALFQGRSAYQIAGSWHTEWAKASGCQDCRYSSIPIPENGHPANLVIGNVLYAVLNQSKHQELATQWVKFLTRSDVQDLVYRSFGRLPATRSALIKIRPSVDRATQVFIDELLHNPHLGILPQWKKRPDEVWQIYNRLLIQVLTTERPVKDIMDEAQAAAERL